MCQSVNLFWKKQFKNVGCVSAFFVADTKLIHGYNFLAPLRKQINGLLSKGMSNIYLKVTIEAFSKLRM